MHTPTRSVRSSPVRAAWGVRVISPVNEALRSATSPFRGGKGASRRDVRHYPATLLPQQIVS